MNYRYLVVYCLFSVLVFSSVYCSYNSQTEEEKIARSYCSSCHLFPEPSLLDKKTWVKGVLPKMAPYLGIGYMGNQYYVNTPDARPQDSLHYNPVSYQRWSAIVDYYEKNAPAKLDSQNRPPIKKLSDRFVAKEGLIKGARPTTTFVRIDPGNKLIYTSNESDSLFSIYDSNLNLVNKQVIHRVIVDARFEQDLSVPGPRSGMMTNIGIIYPNNLRTGSLDPFQIDGKANISFSNPIAENLPRPVETVPADFNNDGKKDYLVCGFGYESGAFFYLENKDSTHYESKMLKPIPGAIKAYIEDWNKDGLQDIIVLFAQAEEGIFIYLNKGNGKFEVKDLLRFPSVWGSTYFEMIDVNKDGLKDIVYTCGDNLDYSQVLKNYHGIYIYLNRGNDRFEQTNFFPIHGCYKALLRDFDLDGDLDIAAISYFPDAKYQLQESFLYLDNKGDYNFEPATVRGYNRGNWVTMDAGDVDGDGDEDIVLGSLIFNNTPRELTMAAGPGELPLILLLTNQTR